MKAMRFMMMMVIAAFMGTTLTSCLDSDGGDQSDFDLVTISSFMGASLVKSDAGVAYNVLNSSSLEIKFENGETLIPRRAVISFDLAEGEVYQEGKTSYDIIFKGYYWYSETVCSVDIEPVESETELVVNKLTSGNGYLDITFQTLALKDFNLSDYKVFVSKVEGNTVFVNMVNPLEIEKPDGTLAAMVSYMLPSKYTMETKFPELETFGTNNDSVYIKFEPKVGQYDTAKFKAKLNN